MNPWINGLKQRRQVHLDLEHLVRLRPAALLFQ